MSVFGNAGLFKCQLTCTHLNLTLGITYHDHKETTGLIAFSFAFIVQMGICKTCVL